MQGRDQLWSQFYAVRINFEATIEYLTAAACHVQIAASGLGVDDLASAILKLFEAALAALFAETVPKGIVGDVLRHAINNGSCETTSQQSRKWCKRVIHTVPLSPPTS